jgi:hypothetical protein
VATSKTNINIILKQVCLFVPASYLLLTQKDPEGLVAAGVYLLERKSNIELSRRSVISFSEFKIDTEGTLHCIFIFCLSSLVVVLNATIEGGIVYMILFATFDPFVAKSFSSEIYSSKELGRFNPLR